MYVKKSISESIEQLLLALTSFRSSIFDVRLKFQSFCPHNKKNLWIIKFEKKKKNVLKRTIHFKYEIK